MTPAKPGKTSKEARRALAQSHQHPRRSLFGVCFPPPQAQHSLVWRVLEQEKLLSGGPTSGAEISPLITLHQGQ